MACENWVDGAPGVTISRQLNLRYTFQSGNKACGNRIESKLDKLGRIIALITSAHGENVDFFQKVKCNSTSPYSEFYLF